WDETITTLEALAQAGKSNDVAVHQARASRTALNASMITIRKSISEMENAISTLLKEPAHAINRSTLTGQHFSDEMSTGVPLLLLSNRPDVRQAEAALAEAFYATNSARSAFYPALTLSGSLGWTNAGGGAILNPGKWLSSAIASLTAPLFNKGTNIANLKIAKARQQEATLRFEQSLLNAGNEVNDALAEWQAASGRISLAQQQISDLEAATEKTRLLVRYTSANYLEVLAAQQSLLNARLTLAQDYTSKIQATIRLYHALGGGTE
ncbi:MAG: TolC family protein, partial [Bacteroidaceae bacterium]